mgnify:CR=1 FL=1
MLISGFIAILISIILNIIILFMDVLFLKERVGEKYVNRYSDCTAGAAS